MPEIKLSCFNCGEILKFVDSIQRRDECEKCHADARVCKNCEFYDSSSYNECREPSADRVKEKDRANFCDFFQARSSLNPSSANKSKTDLMAAAEALFKKK